MMPVAETMKQMRVGQPCIEANCVSPSMVRAGINFHRPDFMKEDVKLSGVRLSAWLMFERIYWFMV